MDFFTHKTRHLWQKRAEGEATTTDKKVDIDVYYYSSEKFVKQDNATVQDITHEMPEWATNVWINIEGIDEQLVKKLMTTFHLHPLAVEDLVDTDNRPKLEWYDNTLFMLTHIISRQESITSKIDFTLQTEQVTMFLVGNTLITVQEGLPGDIWHGVRHELENPASTLRKCGDSGFLLYSLVSAIVDTVDPILEELEDKLEELELEMLDRPSKKINRKVYLVKRHLMTLRSTLVPTRKMMQKILDAEKLQAEHQALVSNGTNKEASSHGNGAEDIATSTGTLARRPGRRGMNKDFSHSLLSASSITYFRDLFTELGEMIESLEQSREMAASLGGLYAEHQSQIQGDVSYVIAIVSVFFLPLTFVAGVYGMNFDIMPELRWDLGYLYVWMVFIGVVLFEVFLFWKIGWISFGSKLDNFLSCTKPRPKKAPHKRRNVNQRSESDQTLELEIKNT